MSDMATLPPAISETAPNPQGRACPACGAPVDVDDKFCNGCGSPQATEVVEAELIEQAHFRCENCGAQVATDPSQRSYVCPFCDSTYVVELDQQAGGRQPPEFVIGFAVTQEEAEKKFRGWISESSLFRPGDLKLARVAEKLRGLYLPFWSFSMLGQSRWSARIGEYWYRTQTYTTTDSKGRTVTRTHRVRETEWWDLAGWHHRYYAGYLVSGSQGLPQEVAERIKPFHLPALKRYAPSYLAGWLSEEYSVERDDALAACQQEFYRREQQNVADFVPGDTHRNLHVQTNFNNVNSDLILLPVYLLSYRYGERLYRFLVNGQTGKVAGDKPLSWKRVWLAIGGGALLVALVVLLFFALRSLAG